MLTENRDGPTRSVAQCVSCPSQGGKYVFQRLENVPDMPIGPTAEKDSLV